jgi:hypothetical protein
MSYKINSEMSGLSETATHTIVDRLCARGYDVSYTADMGDVNYRHHDDAPDIPDVVWEEVAVGLEDVKDPE